MAKVLLSVLAAFSFTLQAQAKSIDLVDGIVPTKWVASANKASGTYSGVFNGRRVTVAVKLDGQNRVQLQALDDLLGANCSSEVGLATQIGTSFSNINWLNFNLDRGNCTTDVEGHSVRMWLWNGTLELSIFQKFGTNCDDYCSEDDNGHMTCTYTCDDQWIKGTFTRN